MVKFPRSHPAALLLAAGAAHAQVTPTSPLCPVSRLTDPACWLNNTVPINTLGTSYAIIDTLGTERAVIVDLDATVSSINTPLIHYTLERSIGVEGEADIASLALDTLAPVTIDAPRLNAVPALSVLLRPTAYAPVLTTPLTVDGTLTVVNAEGARDVPLALPGVVHAGRIVIGSESSPVLAHIDLPDLLATQSLDLDHAHGGFRADSLVSADSVSAVAGAHHIALPSLDVTPDTIDYEFFITTGGSLDLRSLTTLPPGSNIILKEGATANLGSLSRLRDAGLYIDGDLDGPLPDITEFDGSTIRLNTPYDVRITDPVLSRPRLVTFSGDAAITIEAHTIDLTDKAPIYSSVGASLVALDGARVSLPNLTELTDGAGRPVSLAISVGDGSCRIDLPELVTLDSISITQPRQPGGSVTIPKLNAPSISADAARIVMPAQAALNHSNIIAAVLEMHAVGSIDRSTITADALDLPALVGATDSELIVRDFDPPALATLDDCVVEANVADLPALTFLRNTTFTLKEEPGRPFRLTLPEDIDLELTTLWTHGSGVVHADLAHDVRLYPEGGPLRIEGNVASFFIRGDALIQIAGDFTPRSGSGSPVSLATGGEPLRIQMLGEGDRILQGLAPDDGPSQTTRPTVSLDVGSDLSRTRLHLAPRRTSTDDALYLFHPDHPPLTIHNASTLVLNGIPVYLGTADPVSGEVSYTDVASLFPPATRCIPYSDGTLCLQSCPPDFSNDNVLDLADVQVFVDRFLSGDPSADVNADGVLDTGDLGAFVAAFLAGC